MKNSTDGYFCIKHLFSSSHISSNILILQMETKFRSCFATVCGFFVCFFASTSCILSDGIEKSSCNSFDKKMTGMFTDAVTPYTIVTILLM